MSYASEVLADNPLFYWRHGEAAGSATALDETANGRNGTYLNTPTLGALGLIPTDINTAMQVGSNTGQCASIANAAWMNVASAFTLEALVKFTSAADATNGDAIMSRYVAATGLQWLLWRNTTGRLAVQVKDGAGTIVNVANASVASQTTNYHLAATWGSSTLRLYVNGAQVATGALASIAASTSPIEVGRYSQAAATTPGATIDESAMFGTELSAARIAVHAGVGLASALSGTWGLVA